MTTSGKAQFDLSVVIVSWNTRDYLRRCLHSVVGDARRAGISAEIIVIDNASTDGTVPALREVFPEIRFVPLERNIGFAAATNVGIRISSGRDLLLLNPDTELRSGALETMLRTLHAMPHAGLVSGLLLNPDGTLQSSGYRFPGLVQSILDFFPLHPRLTTSSLNGRIPPGDGVSPYTVDHPLGACMLARREIVEQVGLLDERYFMYSEEIDWCRRIRAAGWTIVVNPDAQITHFGGQSTRQMPEEMFLELHRSRARYFRRFESPRLLRLIALVARAAALWARMSLHRNAAASRRDSASLREVARIYEDARSGHD